MLSSINYQIELERVDKPEEVNNMKTLRKLFSKNLVPDHFSALEKFKQYLAYMLVQYFKDSHVK